MNRRIGACLLAIFLVAALPAEALASNLTEAQKKQKELQNQLNSLNSEKKEAKQVLVSNQKKREEIIKNLEDKGFAKQAIEEKLAQLDSAIRTLTESIALSETEYARQLALFQQRIVVMYQRSKSWQALNLVVDSHNISDFYKNRSAMKAISKADQDMMAALEAKRIEIEDLKRRKQEEEATTQEQLEAQLIAIKDLQSSRSLVDQDIKSSKKSLDQLEREEDEINAEAQEVSALIKRLKTANIKYVGGDMLWPAPGNYKVSSPYGWRIHPIFKKKRFHSGIDIHAAKGETIAAANSGKVIYAGARTGYGNTVIIDHGGGVTTLYAHIMTRGILVSEGQNVDAGQAIAKVGSTGWSTGPHLHFEYRKAGDTQDPLSHLGKKQ